MVGRGHEGEVTDLAVSCCNKHVASSSNDCSIRVWSLQVATAALNAVLAHVAALVLRQRELHGSVMHESCITLVVQALPVTTSALHDS